MTSFSAALTRRALLAVTFALACTMVARPGRAAEPVGRINALRGRATASSGGAQRTLEVGAEIFRDEAVETEGDARLTITSDQVGELKLGGSTRVEFASEVGMTGIRLEQGAILVDAPEGREVVLETPLAAITAEGTRVFAGPSNGVTGVFVERGSASVKNKAGEVLLAGEEGTDLTSAGIAPTPAKAWDAARIAAALESVS